MVFGPRSDQIEVSVVPIHLLFLNLKNLSNKSVQGETEAIDTKAMSRVLREPFVSKISNFRARQSRVAAPSPAGSASKVDHPQYCHAILEQELSLP